MTRFDVNYRMRIRRFAFRREGLAIPILRLLLAAMAWPWLIVGACIAPTPAFAQFLCSGSANGSSGLSAGASTAGANSVACGAGANATDGGTGTANSVAVGFNANASGGGGLGAFNNAFGTSANASGNSVVFQPENTAAGAFSNASGNDGLNSAFGSHANASGQNSANVAIGRFANASGDGTSNTAVGSSATATGANSVAIGAGSVANVANTFSVGSIFNTRTVVNVSAGTIAPGSTDAVNGGQLFTANQRVATAFGGGAALDANGQLTAPTYTIAGTNFNNVGSAFAAVNTQLGYFQVNSTGPAATATGTNAIAIGSGAQATQPGSIAMGVGAASTGSNAIAIGTGAVATGSVAVGAGASAANGGAAFGDNSTATGANATAIGPAATATFANSTAIGNGAAATAANQVAIGTASSTYRMPGIASAASLAAQSGPVSFVTTDTAGNLATSSFNPASLAALQSSVTSLQSQVLDNRLEARTGTAVALAAGSTPALQPGRKFALSAGYGNFEGANAFAVGATALLYDGKSYAIVGNAGGGIGLERSVGGGRGAVSIQW